MINEKAQNPPESQEFLEVQSNQQQLEISMQTLLQKFTNEIYKKLLNRELTLDGMSLKDLQEYRNGLSIYKSDLAAHRDVVEKQIQQKGAKKRKAPTTAERAANWLAAIGIIFLCLVGIITGGALSVYQIQQVQADRLKQVLLIVVIGVGLLLFVLICKWICPRRNINYMKNKKKNE